MSSPFSILLSKNKVLLCFTRLDCGGGRMNLGNRKCKVEDGVSACPSLVLALGSGSIWISSRLSPGVLLIWNSFGPLQDYYGLDTKYVVWAKTHGHGAVCPYLQYQSFLGNHGFKNIFAFFFNDPEE